MHRVLFSSEINGPVSVPPARSRTGRDSVHLLCFLLYEHFITKEIKLFLKLDVVQLCETQKVRLFLVMVGLIGLCG